MSTTNNTTNMSTPLNNKNEELDGAPNMAESTSNTNTMPVSYFSSIDQKQLGKNVSEKALVLLQTRSLLYVQKMCFTW